MAGGFRSRSKSGDKPTSTSTSRPKGVKDGGRKQSQPRQQRRSPQQREVRRFVEAGVDKPRAAAFDVLTDVRVNDAYANLVLPALLRERRITGRDAAFATELTYGTLRTQGVLDRVIAAASSRSVTQIDPTLLDALRLGVYQLLYTRVEQHAAVDTTVRMAEAVGQPKAKGFVNAVMRTTSRSTPEQWMEQLTPEESLAAVAFRHAHPEWIARSFARALGSDAELDEALEADSQRPTVHLVARPGELTAEELALVTGGEQGRYSPYAVYLDGGDPGELEPVREGMAAVQDEGSQLIARAVVEAPLEGPDQGRWLDLCAGPGGKAALMGALAQIDGAHVDAVEKTPHRARLVDNSVRDLPVTVHVADGRSPHIGTGFDRVLVDAPCSGLGALRRRPEARWRKRDSDIAGLASLQGELLESACSLVRPGGVVVYSTCSPDVRETREIVDRAVNEWGMQELSAHEYALGMDNVGEHKSVQMWPHRHGADAMFFAVLRRPVS